mgnify:CR=1 FL=1
MGIYCLIATMLCSVVISFVVVSHMIRKFLKELDEIEKKHREELLSIAKNVTSKS